MSIYSETVLAMVRERSILGGKIMAAELRGPDAQRDVVRRLIEQKLEGLYARRASFSDPLVQVSCGLADALQAVPCGEGAS
ncbi:hypothetical protein IVB30_32750 [Bradyrhizobium sp. 200]|uniref:hypothetical protein n=1 Tax=Bradyrhizobium sp. 200 TaxID=2782665 RepID=UPI001FFF5A31|nr:hypothetical protein [Bradyrhizobium sp. 200]UPJ47911.1 hypothetical protein IVB30_32750 [Bradyrhizobium sp. 200]